MADAGEPPEAGAGAPSAGADAAAVPDDSPPLREDYVQNAVSFLQHPKVRGSSIASRRDFLEKKGLSAAEVAEAFRRVPEEEPMAAAPAPAPVAAPAAPRPPARLAPALPAASQYGPAASLPYASPPGTAPPFPPPVSAAAGQLVSAPQPAAAPAPPAAQAPPPLRWTQAVLLAGAAAGGGLLLHRAVAPSAGKWGDAARARLGLVGSHELAAREAATAAALTAAAAAAARAAAEAAVAEGGARVTNAAAALEAQSTELRSSLADMRAALTAVAADAARAAAAAEAPPAPAPAPPAPPSPAPLGRAELRAELAAFAAGLASSSAAAGGTPARAGEPAGSPWPGGPAATGADSSPALAAIAAQLAELRALLSSRTPQRGGGVPAAGDTDGGGWAGRDAALSATSPGGFAGSGRPLANGGNELQARAATSQPGYGRPAAAEPPAPWERDIGQPWVPLGSPAQQQPPSPPPLPPPATAPFGNGGGPLSVGSPGGSAGRGPPPAPADVAPHSGAYLELLAMLQAGKTPPGIRQIDDKPPRPGMPLPPPQTPRPKPWETAVAARGPGGPPAAAAAMSSEGWAGFDTAPRPVAALETHALPPWEPPAGRHSPPAGPPRARLTEIEDGPVATGSISSSGDGGPEAAQDETPWVPPAAPTFQSSRAAAAVQPGGAGMGAAHANGRSDSPAPMTFS